MFPAPMKHRLLQAFDIENADKKAMSNCLLAFDELARKSAVSVIIDRLDKADLQSFLLLVEKSQFTTALSFARTKLPNLDTLVATQINHEFKKLFD